MKSLNLLRPPIRPTTTLQRLRNVL